MGSVSGNGLGGRKKNTPFDHVLDANQFRDPLLVWRRYECMSGCLVPFTIFAIVEATAVSSFVPNNRMIISPYSGRYKRDLLWRIIASNSAAFRWSAHLASSVKLRSADDIIVGSLSLAGAEAGCLTNWRAASIPPEAGRSVFRTSISAFRALNFSSIWKGRKRKVTR